MQCLSWIHVVWEHLVICLFVGANKNSSLPDDVIVEILSRLPTECLLECRRVCKHWMSLTSSPDFIHKHFLKQLATPSILISNQERHHGILEQKVLSIHERGAAAVGSSLQKNCINKLRPESVFHVPPRLRNSALTNYCNTGLLIFMPDHPLIFPCSSSRIKSFIVCNPVTQEKVVINTYGGSICACFYHPLAREYRLLWLRCLDRSSIMFKILNLGTHSSLSWRHLPNYARLPRYDSPAAVLINNEGGLLHWMINDSEIEQPCCIESIIVFNINTEEFSTMPHPGDKCNMSWRRHKYMYLLELKLETGSGSLLCLCDCSMQGQIDMWVLENYEKRVWVRRHNIFTEMDVDRYPFALTVKNYEVVPFGLQNGEMLIYWRYRGVFAYNMNMVTMRKINHMFSVKDVSINCVGLYTKSLVSFTNFSHPGLHINMEPF